MCISPTRIWTFDYQNRADPNKIHRFLGIFPDPAGGSVRRIGNALILGLAALTLVVAILCSGIAVYIAQTGGRVRHPEFRPSETQSPSSENDHQDK